MVKKKRHPLADRWAAEAQLLELEEANKTSTKPDGTAFRDRERNDGSGKRDVLFNQGKIDGSGHGHVAESRPNGPDGDRVYHYVRDNNEEVYRDDNPNSSTYTGH